MTNKNRLTFNSSPADVLNKTLIIFISFDILLMILDLTFTYATYLNSHAIQQLFNLAREGSLGSWYSSTQLLFTGIILWLLFARFYRDEKHENYKKYSWALIALFFTFMAIDDAAAIHESVGSVYEDIVSNADKTHDIIGGSFLEEYPSYSWQVILGPLFLFMGLFIFIFLWFELSQTSMRVLLVAALSCYALAVGLDYIEGVYGGYKSFIVATSMDYDSVRHLSKVIEEFLEMLGTTFFLGLFVTHLANHTESIEIKFSKT